MQDEQQRDSGARRRAGRTYAAAGAAALVGLTALGTAVPAGTAGATDHAVVTRTVAVTGPGAAGLSASPAPVTGPQMRLEVAYQRLGDVVTLTISLDGSVYAPLDAKNVPLEFPTPARRNIGLGEELAWGDGTTSDTAARPVHCGEPRRLHQVKDSYKVTKRYAATGTYTVRYTFKACGLTDERITATLPITF
jgi:hypothetical protein